MPRPSADPALSPLLLLRLPFSFQHLMMNLRPSSVSPPPRTRGGDSEIRIGTVNPPRRQERDRDTQRCRNRRTEIGRRRVEGDISGWRLEEAKVFLWIVAPSGESSSSSNEVKVSVVDAERFSRDSSDETKRRQRRQKASAAVALRAAPRPLTLLLRPWAQRRSGLKHYR